MEGKLNGGSIPLGYNLTKEKTLAIDEETAPIVVEVFTRYADGEIMIDIAKDLALRGVKSKYGKRITLNIIHYMLKNVTLGNTASAIQSTLILSLPLSRKIGLSAFRKKW